MHVASKMWCLGRLLPLIIGDLVPEDDEKWELFLQLTIIDYVFAPKTTSKVVAYVRLLMVEWEHFLISYYCRGTAYGRYVSVL